MPGKGKKLMGKMPPKPKDKPLVIQKKSTAPMRKNEARPYATASIPPKPEGVLKQVPGFGRRKAKPVTRRGGK